MGRLTSFSPWCTKKRCQGGQEALSAKHQVRVLVALHGPARAVGAVQVALWDGWEVKRSVCVCLTFPPAVMPVGVFLLTVQMHQYPGGCNHKLSLRLFWRFSAVK